jgi:ParB/RepB/Spo0J family partition protein
MARKPKGAAQVERTGQALTNLTIEYVTPNSITPNIYNPNRQNGHEFDLLKKSIQEDGFTQPVIVGQDGHIVDGEHRWRAAQALGLETIPIVRVPMDAAQARVATLRHNRARGSEDLELAVAVLRDLETLGALDWAADSLDLSDEELNRLLEDVPAPEALAGDDFGEAWVPGDEGSQDTATATTASTAAASDALRAREQALANARTEEERSAIMRDRAVYRVTLSFANEQAAVVRDVLGDSPAEKLLALCEAEAARLAS